MNDRIQKYIDAIPGAVAGDGGHNQTFPVACSLVNGFALSESEAMTWMRVYSQKCDPLWTEKELIHKVQSAMSATHDKPRGHLIGGTAPVPKVKTDREVHVVKVAKPKEPPVGVKLPEPIPDGVRVLLQKVYEPGEYVRIVPGDYGEETAEAPKDRPDGNGVVLKVEEWIEKFEAKGNDPNKLWNNGGEGLQWGLFIGLNPLKNRGKSDSDVTSFRHALIEFDDIPLESQWQLIQESNIPCSAVIHSGGKSIHAWVRVNAKDRLEYDQRVKLLHDTFADYGVDQQNRNPARLSRLPSCRRGHSRQELLATDIGAESFSNWMYDREGESGGRVYTAAEMMAFDSENDPNCLMGDRYLCRGGSVLLVGQSGIGKSSMTMQMAVLLALGRNVFGMVVKRPMKQIVIQAENDFGDMSEMLQGVLEAMDISEFDPEFDIIKENIRFIEDFNHSGDAFIAEVQRKVDRYSPDIVWIDPLLSFIGDDISRQDVCAKFLRQGLNPISKVSGVSWFIPHHTNKPPIDPKFKQTGSYLGTGSSELVNWARAVITLKETETKGTFNLDFEKRGKRAGVRDLDMVRTTKLWLKHADHGIHWEQIEEPDAPVKVVKKKKEPKPPGNPSALDRFNGEDLGMVKFLPYLKKDGKTTWTRAEILAEIESFCGLKRKAAIEHILPMLEAFLNSDESGKVWSLKP